MKTRYIKASDKVTGKRRWASVEAARRKVKDGQLYFISRRGCWFRPNACGYTCELSEAGIYDAATARGYLDVEGLSVVPVRTMRRAVIDQIAYHQKAAAMLQSISILATNT